MRNIAETAWGASVDTLLNYYISHVRSKSDYGNILWGAAAPTHLRKLDVVQNIVLLIAFSFSSYIL